MQLLVIPLDPVTVTREQRSALALHSPHEELEAALGPSLNLVCSGLSKLRDFSHPSYPLLSRPFIVFVALLWLLFNSFMSFFVLCCPKLHVVLKVKPHQYNVEREDCSTQPVSCAVLGAPLDIVVHSSCLGTLDSFSTHC